MKRLLIAFILFFLFFISLIFFWRWSASPVDSDSNTPKIFVIEKGQGVKQIAKNLKNEGLIRNQVVFFLLTKRLGVDKRIEAGDYRLYPSMNAYEIAEELTHGTLDVWVTIPEGKRTEEVAEILEKNIPTYEDSWIQKLSSYEGYLFPDTYLIPKDANIDFIIEMLGNNFEKKYNTLDNTSTLSKEEVVILASLIEREARHAEDRPLISSVLHNRLSSGMALQVDATIQYAKGNPSDGWWTPVLQSEYRSLESNYNTYLYPGLPPGPIANPGLESLKAAISPSDTDYVYYITDKNGINRYASTISGHNANIKKYGLSSN